VVEAAKMGWPARAKKKEARKARIKERLATREKARTGGTLNVENLEEIQQSMAQILKPSSFSGWVLLGYEDETSLALQGSGHGGVGELLSALKDDEVQYALVRLPELKESGFIHATTDVFISWTGPKANKILAAKRTTFLGEIQKNFVSQSCSAHGQWACEFHRVNHSLEMPRWRWLSSH